MLILYVLLSFKVKVKVKVKVVAASLPACSGKPFLGNASVVMTYFY